jgi:hypothetical protein
MRTVQRLHQRQRDAGDDASGNFPEEGEFAQQLRRNGQPCQGWQQCEGSGTSMPAQQRQVRQHTKGNNKLNFRQ